MSKEDLMIGDWVQDSFGNFLNVATHWILSNAKDFEPIPITPEILIENGFKNTKPGEYELRVGRSNKHVEIYFEGGNVLLSSINTKIDQLNVNVTFESSYARVDERLYVHELQHILKLCKIDKEIKL